MNIPRLKPHQEWHAQLHTTTHTLVRSSELEHIKNPSNPPSLVHNNTPAKLIGKLIETDKHDLLIFLSSLIFNNHNHHPASNFLIYWNVYDSKPLAKKSALCSLKSTFYIIIPLPSPKISLKKWYFTEMWWVLGVVLGNLSKLRAPLLLSNNVECMVAGDAKFILNWVPTFWINLLKGSR